jgi:hypothetical protein
MNDDKTSPTTTREPFSSESRGLDGLPLEAGQRLEIRNARVGDTVIGQSWMPAVVGQAATSVEIEMPASANLGGRRVETVEVSIDELLRQSAGIRRVPAFNAGARGRVGRPLGQALQVAEGEGMVTEAAKVSATNPTSS